MRLRKWNGTHDNSKDAMTNAKWNGTHDNSKDAMTSAGQSHLTPVHVNNIGLSQHIPNNHILAFPFQRSARRFGTRSIILDHTLSFCLDHFHIRRDIILHDQRAWSIGHKSYSRIGIGNNCGINREEDMTGTYPGSVGGTAFNGEGDYGSVLYNVDELGRCRAE